ncbi:MAG: Rrf2 family transcriptional regulator [bacterium]
MKFSTKTTYGLRALMFLAKQPKQQLTPLSVIARQEKISLKYLEIIFAQLKQAGLVKSVQGATGGYILAQPLNQITTYDIIKVLEKDLVIFHCLDAQGELHCNHHCHCGVNLIFPQVQQAIVKTLKQLKLNQLVKQ